MKRFGTVRQRHRRTGSSSGVRTPQNTIQDLGTVISESGNATTAIGACATAQQRKMAALARWARHEPNPAARDLFGKMEDVYRVRVELMKSLQTAEAQFGEVMAWVLAQEKEMETLRKADERAAQNVFRLQRTTKELAIDPKAKQAKIKQVEEELGRAEAEAQAASDRYADATRDFEIAKATAIKAGLRAYGTSTATLLGKEKVMVDALRDLAADMPPEPIHLAEDKAQYIDRGVESDRIVSDAVLEANMEILFFDSQGDEAAKVLRGRRSVSDAFDVLTTDGQLVDELEDDHIFEEAFPEIPRAGEPLLGSATLRERASAAPGHRTSLTISSTAPSRSGSHSGPSRSHSASHSASSPLSPRSPTLSPRPLDSKPPPVAPRERDVFPPEPEGGEEVYEDVYAVPNEVIKRAGGVPGVTDHHSADLGYADVAGGSGECDADNWVPPPRAAALAPPSPVSPSTNPSDVPEKDKSERKGTPEKSERKDSAGKVDRKQAPPPPLPKARGTATPPNVPSALASNPFLEEMIQAELGSGAGSGRQSPPVRRGSDVDRVARPPRPLSGEFKGKATRPDKRPPLSATPSPQSSPVGSPKPPRSNSNLSSPIASPTLNPRHDAGPNKGALAAGGSAAAASPGGVRKIQSFASGSAPTVRLSRPSRPSVDQASGDA
eukprot:m.12944 g.12944  ORF g.12944 m.12944 type:complete len:666 (+) comp4605_c0_seq1:2228-4225(+)